LAEADSTSTLSLDGCVGEQSRLVNPQTSDYMEEAVRRVKEGIKTRFHNEQYRLGPYMSY